jgi:cell division septum initiation protein DivIVA
MSKEEAKKEIKRLKEEIKEDASKEEELMKRIQEIQDFQKRIYEEGNREIRDKTRKESKKGKEVVQAKNGGMMNKKRLTRTVPPKKGPNSQGMRGTGAAIRGTKFKGVF